MARPNSRQWPPERGFGPATGCARPAAPRALSTPSGGIRAREFAGGIFSSGDFEPNRKPQPGGTTQRHAKAPPWQARRDAPHEVVRFAARTVRAWGTADDD